MRRNDTKLIEYLKKKKKKRQIAVFACSLLQEDHVYHGCSCQKWNNGCASQMFRLVPVFGNKPKHLTFSVTGSEHGHWILLTLDGFRKIGM